MTNEIQQVAETLTNTVSVTTHMTPQAAAYTFKEWAGVIGMIVASVYSSCHAVFVVVVHYGGLRKMRSDFIGKPISGCRAASRKSKIQCQSTRTKRYGCPVPSK